MAAIETENDERFISKEISAFYAQHRPTHSNEFYKFIVEHLREKLPATNSLALDVGCGTGSSTRPLVEYFDKVIGCDISETQLAEARRDPSNLPNLSFRVAQFDQLPAEDGTVDLVTVSQAVHWFRPIENFYKEVDRVLRPGGCLAVYEYGRSQYINHPNVEELSQAYKELREDERLNKYADESFYRTIGLEDITTPYSDVMRDSSFKLDRHLSLEEYLGELWSRSTIYLYRKNNPGNDGPIDDYIKKVRKYLGDKPAKDIMIDIRYYVHLVMGRKPQGNA